MSLRPISASVDPASLRQPVLINCANVISSHHSLWRLFLRELVRTASGDREGQLPGVALVLTQCPAQVSTVPESSHKEPRLPVCPHPHTTTVNNTKAAFPRRVPGAWG